MCPYCNTPLEKVKKIGFGIVVYCCPNPECENSRFMVGTDKMWKKVESLQKIRKCTTRYHKENKEKRSVYMREYYARKKREQKENQ